MAGKTQETLFEHFRSIASDLKAGSSGSTPASSDNTVGITGSDTSIPVIGSPPPPTASSQTSSSGGSSGLGLAAEVFRSGLGIVPLVTGLMGLFGGGSSAPPPLTKYAMPQSLDFTGADTSSGIGEASFNQLGAPRLSGAAVDNSNGASSAALTGSGSGSAPAPQISVTVQAMDAQSFMDHSNDIAQAVRQAMLSLSSINDVVNEL
jgi:hypothetical protein